MLRINLRNGKRALGKNKIFVKMNKYKSASSSSEQETSGEGFKSLNNKVNEIGASKKLNKFINFKL